MFRLTGAWVKKDPWPLLRAQDHKRSINGGLLNSSQVISPRPRGGRDH